MPADLWISLTMKIMALGHTLRDAQHMAAVILIERLVVYTIMGYRLPADEPKRNSVDFAVTRETRTRGPAGFCGVFPVHPGTAADSTRALLFTQ
ncbi:MAG: hypothetical protein WC379_09255 [Methanoregula sp.]|jgi:hypothetical protein